jgi:hypothetical protein
MNLKKWVQITKKEPIELPMCDNVVKARCLTCSSKWVCVAGVKYQLEDEGFKKEIVNFLEVTGCHL